MKTLLLCLLLPVTVAAQVPQAPPKRPVLVGLDLTKSLLTATTGWPLFRRAVLVEPAVKVPLRGSQTLTIQPGYNRITTRTVYRNINQQYEGFSLKLGAERRTGIQTVIGGQGFISVYRQSGTFTFPGASFGDYVGALPTRSKVTLGVEPHFDGFVALSDRFELRTIMRLGIGATVGYQSADPPAVYVPGMGIGTGRTFFVSPGLGVQLLYRSGPRTRAD